LKLSKEEKQVVMKHYTLEALDRFRNLSMSISARIKCAEHLKKCDQCLALQEKLHLNDMFVTELKKAIELLNEASSKSEITFHNLMRLFK